MSLVKRLEEDMKNALRAREEGRLRLSVIRLARAAVKNREIELKRPLTDAEVMDVLAREIRQRRDVLPDYRRAGREDLVRQLEQEIAVLQEYLPAPLTEEELREHAREVIAQVGARTVKDLGKVMGPLMARVRGRAEGQEVQRVVRELLQG